METGYDEKYLDQLGKMKRPIPGSSLTNDPDNPKPFEKAPEFTKQKDALEELFTRMTSEEVYSPMIDAINKGTTIMEMTQVVLMEGFRQGKWNPDLFMMLIEPTAYMTMALVERVGIDYEVDREAEEPTGEEQDSEIQNKFDQVSKSGISAESVPKEILEEIESLPVESLISKPEASTPMPEGGEESLIQKPVGV